MTQAFIYRGGAFSNPIRTDVIHGCIPLTVGDVCEISPDPPYTARGKPILAGGRWVLGHFCHPEEVHGPGIKVERIARQRAAIFPILSKMFSRLGAQQAPEVIFRITAESVGHPVLNLTWKRPDAHVGHPDVFNFPINADQSQGPRP